MKHVNSSPHAIVLAVVDAGPPEHGLLDPRLVFRKGLGVVDPGTISSIAFCDAYLKNKIKSSCRVFH